MAQATTDQIPVKMDAATARWIIGFLLILTSAMTFLLNTHHGIGVLPDTTRYMRLGPMPYDAPLFAWVLDAVRAIGLPFNEGARALGLALVCANTLLIWDMLVRGTGDLRYAATGTAMIILSPQFVGLHAVAMSEPLFLFMLFLVVYAFLAYQRTRHPAWLSASAASLGLAMLARFSAAPLSIVIAGLLLLDPRRNLRQRIREIALFAIVSGAVFFTWAIASKLTTGHAIGRDLVLYGNAGSERWLNGLASLATFLLPSQVPLAARIALLLVAIGAVLWLLVRHVRELAAQRRSWTSQEAIPLLWGFFAPLYALFLVLAISLEANLFMTPRYQLPLYVALVIAGTSLAAANARRGRGKARLLHWLLAGTAALVLAANLVRSFDRTRDAHFNGIGYASVSWSNSPTVAAVRALPADAVIFSNAPDALNFLTPRKALFVPFKVHPRTSQPDPAAPVSDVLARMRESRADGEGYVVFLDDVDWRWYLMTEPELVKSLGLRLRRRGGDGRIYTIEGDPSS